MQSNDVKAVDWQNNALRLLDQRILPRAENYIDCTSVDSVIDAIKQMVVRGAPAIGIAAAYGVVLSAKAQVAQGGLDGRAGFERDLDRLAAARPTAVNLLWAVNRMKRLSQATKFDADLVSLLLQEAHAILAQDIADNHTMAELACDAMALEAAGPVSVLTHCNAGSLATGGYGTALGVIRSAWRRQLIDRVYADETRPWLQGARLTAWELQKDQVPVTLNADVAAAWLMANKNIRWVIVGADRITANGDVANKIGTYGLAVLARFHGVKMMVVAPSSTIDMALPNGKAIDIEMRSSEELTHLNGMQIAPDKIATINPVFDVTPANLIDFIVTERGIVRSPDLATMRALFG